MHEPAFAPEAHGGDPLKTVADAMSLAAQAAREGAADARARVSEVMPAISGFVGRLVYTTCYAVSYGVVFPTVFVIQAVPKDNALVYGLVDGAHAARDAIVGGQEGPTAFEKPGGGSPHGVGGGEAYV